MPGQTVVSIDGAAFCVNGRPIYEGRSFRGMKVEGLLLNSRMVQGIFDDLNPRTRHLWNYPDGPWDPERNTNELVAAMGAWRDCGLLGFTINLQGGCPYGYCEGKQPWHNSAFDADGSLRGDYADRLRRILDQADTLGMAPILGLFYFGQDYRLQDEAAVIRATENITDWLVQREYTNVLIEINNEANANYKHAILKAPRVHELIRLVQQRSAGKLKTPAERLLVTTSLGGGLLPTEEVVAASDFVLMHGDGRGVAGGASDPQCMRNYIDRCRELSSYHGQPILNNEDDHYDFDADDSNFLAAVSRYSGWGYFDFRRQGEGYEDGYQSVPVNWGISSARKCGFFRLVAAMTGSRPPDFAAESGCHGDEKA